MTNFVVTELVRAFFGKKVRIPRTLSMQNSPEIAACIYFNQLNIYQRFFHIISHLSVTRPELCLVLIIIYIV